MRGQRLLADLNTGAIVAISGQMVSLKLILSAISVMIAAQEVEVEVEVKVEYDDWP